MTSVSILVAAANPAKASDLASILAGLGYAVPAVVGSGPELALQAANLKPDLVLIDLDLPGEPGGSAVGPQALENLRLPVVYLAGPDEAGPARAAFAGRLDHVGYPLDPRELAKTVEIVLRSHDLEQRLAAQASIALENARLHAETERRATELAALNKASQAIVSTLNLESVLQVVITEVKDLFAAQGASVLLRDPGTDELVFASVVGPRASDLAGTRMPISKGIAGWAIDQRKSVFINDVQDDPRFYGDIDTKSGLITASIAASPLTFRGAVWGVVEVINKASGPFEQRDLELLEALTRSAAIAFENARLYQVEREQLQRLQESQARLIQAEKMSALGRLTASIAHEINNPIQAVQSCLSLLHEELGHGVDPEEMQHDLRIAEGEVRRISDIVRRLREFYRPARAGLYATDVKAVLESMLELVGKQLQNSNVVVERDWPADLPAVQANPDQLKQVFVNLALNAVDAMPNGGTLKVSAAVDRGPSKRGHRWPPGVHIYFQDNGEGISRDLQARIFEPFFTTKAGGTGLGLSISYEIIQSFSGEITVTSEAGGGTTFALELVSYEG